ncbi:MAG: LysE family translocator [Endozoicomonas sp. (ex Botrylloides leachii)]|nr:LysE family translocator [Endozoicomonas sp. (ex Botrylloides leachii)]
MSFHLWLSLLIICLLGAMTPGPSLAVVTRHTLSGGRTQGLVTAWSHAVGVGLYALMTLLGLGLLFQKFPLLFKAISYGGAGYLFYLGIRALFSKGGAAETLTAGRKISLKKASWDGMAISLLNPKLALFFIALFSQYVSAGSGLYGQLIIIATPLFVDGLWYTLIACTLSRPSILEKLKRQAHLVDKSCGIIFILLACRVLWLL